MQAPSHINVKATNNNEVPAPSQKAGFFKLLEEAKMLLRTHAEMHQRLIVSDEKIKAKKMHFSVDSPKRKTEESRERALTCSAEELAEETKIFIAAQTGNQFHNKMNSLCLEWAETLSSYDSETNFKELSSQMMFDELVSLKNLGMEFKLSDASGQAINVVKKSGPIPYEGERGLRLGSQLFECDSSNSELIESKMKYFENLYKSNDCTIERYEIEGEIFDFCVQPVVLLATSDSSPKSLIFSGQHYEIFENNEIVDAVLKMQKISEVFKNTFTCEETWLRDFALKVFTLNCERRKHFIQK